MENPPPKCLICDEPYPQKGLSFFKFPRDESRFNMWIKSISPLLDILRLSSNDIHENENERICSKHFKDKDFINFKKDSLVQNACPTIGIPELTASLFKGDEMEACTHIQKNSSNLPAVEMMQESDIFTCGRCKSEFKAMSAFIDHKRTSCEMTIQSAVADENNVADIAVPLNNSLVLSFDNRVPLENCSVHTINESGELVEVVHDHNSVENEVVSLLVSDGRFLIANTSMDLSSPTGQLILTSSDMNSKLVLTQDGNENFVSNEENAFNCDEGIIITDDPNCITPEGYMITDEEKTELDKVFLTGDSALVSNNSEVLVNHQLVNTLLSGNAGQFNVTEDCTGNRKVVINCNYVSEQQPKGEIMKWSCSYCPKKFDKHFNMLQHERIHTGERPFQCIICGRAFTQKANVRKHMIRHKVWPQAKQTLRIDVDQNQRPVIDQSMLDRMNYSCQYCSMSFKSYSLHKKHLAVHSDYKVYRCIQRGCDETFGDLDDFLSHSETHKIMEFKCHVCLKTFTNLGELGAHQYEHEVNLRIRKQKIELDLKCEVCHSKFKTAESLKNHIAVDSHKYECPQCRAIFHSERFLRRHLIIHLDPSTSKFECPECKKTFRTQKYLNNHSLIHSSEKPYACEHCQKQFSSTYRLKRHVAVHLDQFLECPYKSYLGCQKKFYRKDKLKDHVNSHNHLRIKPCCVCSKSCQTLGKLQYHMLKEHGVSERSQVMRCPSCQQTFRQLKQLTQHHCTVGDRAFKTRVRDKTSKVEISNIEIIMVPYVPNKNEAGVT